MLQNAREEFESGQDYAAVECIEAVGSLLPLLGDRNNQPRNHFLLSPMAIGIGPFSQGGLITTCGNFLNIHLFAEAVLEVL